MTHRRLWAFPPPVAKIAVASALHDGLRARELYVGAKTLGEREVRAADQQESKLRLNQFLGALCVPASSDIDFIGILRLRADTVFNGVTFGERGKRQRHGLSHVRGFFRPPPLFAEATIHIAQSLAHECARAFLAQFCLKGFDERNQDLSLYLGLFDDGDVHASSSLQLIQPGQRPSSPFLRNLSSDEVERAL